MGRIGLTDGIRNEAKEQREREKEGERIVVGEDVSGSYVRPDEKARQESGFERDGEIKKEKREK